MTTKGILVQPGVVDSDYQGEIKIMLRALRYCIFPAQTHIAQLLLIPYKDVESNAPLCCSGPTSWQAFIN